jgi:hypothetical protein
VEAAAPAPDIVPAPETAPEAAAVIVETAAAPSPVSVPELTHPEPGPVIAEAAAVPEDVTVSMPETVPEAAPAAAPPAALHNTLWDAARMVAEAASTQQAPPSVAAPPPLPLAAALPPEPVPVPQPAPAPTLVPEAQAISAFMTNLRRAPDSVQWAVFGGTAAFLGVIWVVIWLAVGK